MTILTTGLILLSNARSRKQEALQVYATTLIEDCDSMRKRMRQVAAGANSSLEGELAKANATIAELREKQLQILHELHLLQEGSSPDPSRLPIVAADPVQTWDVSQTS